MSIPVLLGVVILVFILARIIPGDPCRAALGERATDAICNAFNVRYGLDKPIPVQFLTYVGNVATGDLGDSIRFGRPVSQILVERGPVTVELTVYALIFAAALGIFLGRLSAIRRNSPIDVGTMIVANLGVSIPVFVLGLFFAYIFAVVLKGTPLALPPSGRLTPGVDVVPLAQAWGLKDLGGPPRVVLDFFSNMNTVNAILTLNGSLLLDALRHMILPAVALGTIPMAIIARMTRSSLLDVLGLDYIRTARAKGVKERDAQRAPARRHGDRAIARGAPLRGRAHRDDLQPGGDRPDHHGGHPGPGLHHHPGGRHHRRDHLHRGEPGRGHLVRAPRSTDPAHLRPAR
jgi:peptide/nickel transport system permease protein